MYNQKQMTKEFVKYASSVLGETSRGLSGLEIERHFNEFAFDYNIELPMCGNYKYYYEIFS